MEEKIIKIVAARLRRFEGQAINQEKLESIRGSVYSATKTNKSASFANVKKWIKAARNMMKKQENAPSKSAKAKQKQVAHVEKVQHYREPPIPEVSRKVEDSLNVIKDEVAPQPPAQEVLLPKPTIIFDKVYLQSIKFEIAGIRQTMERVSRQLDKLEKELSEHRSE